MSTILGIYARRNRLDLAAVQPVVDALGRFGNRYLTRVDFPGFVMVSANELQGEASFQRVGNAGAVFAVVGTMADEGIVTRPPTATLAKAWTSEGTKCWERLEGAFVAAVYEPERHRLDIANDKFGMRPWFMVQAGDLVAFCNELDPLLHLPGFKPEVNREAMADYFCLGTTLGEETLFKGQHNLAPGSFRTYSEEKIVETQYWTPRIPIDRTCTIEEHAARIAELMRTIVPQIPDQLTNVNCLVSAGADSRLILSCLRPDQLRSLPFLTSKLSILEAHEDRDLIGATALAQRLGLQHRLLEVAFSERDFGPQYFDEVKAARAAKILGGWHGGEFLGGFCSKGAPIRNMPTKAEIDETLRRYFGWRFRWRLGTHPHERLQQEFARMTAENAAFQFQIRQFSRAYFSTIYGGSRGSWLQPYEIINQGHSPFWDSRFLAALLAVPMEFVADYRLYNVIFRDHLTALTDIPSNSPLTLRPDTAIPPIAIGTEPKAALRPKYQNALKAYATDATTWSRNGYRKAAAQQALSDGEAEFTKRFVDFEAWMRRFGMLGSNA